MPIRIGTRPSAMAVAQAEGVAEALAKLGADVEVVRITTSGDVWTGNLADLGGKGAFTRELDVAQADREVDLAVHCLKDVPSGIHEGLDIVAYLPRDDVRDAVVSRHGGGLDDLPAGAVVGTSSPRRAAQVARGWPMLRVSAMRGNADTRLGKLYAGEVDAIVLAVAGLERIGAAERITAVIPLDQMLPAVGAGTIVITARRGDTPMADLAGRLDHEPTRRRSTAERTMLVALDGTCQSAIAGLATIDDDSDVHLRGAVYSRDGVVSLEANACDPGDGTSAGEAVAAALLERGAQALLS